MNNLKGIGNKVKTKNEQKYFDLKMKQIWLNSVKN